MDVVFSSSFFFFNWTLISFEGCIKLPSMDSMLKDIKWKEQEMAKRWRTAFSHPWEDLLQISSCPCCKLEPLFLQVRHQSETHHPGWLRRIHGWDRKPGWSKTKLPEAAADRSKTWSKCHLRCLHTVPVSSERAGEVGRGPPGHPHSVGPSGPAHADEAFQRAWVQEIFPVAPHSVGCRYRRGILRQQESAARSHDIAWQD